MRRRLAYVVPTFVWFLWGSTLRVVGGQQVDSALSVEENVHGQNNEDKRLWGSSMAHPSSQEEAEEGGVLTGTVSAGNNKRGGNNSAGDGDARSDPRRNSTAHSFVPFVSKASTTTSIPSLPNGFRLKSRVYLSSEDGMAHFDHDSVIEFPYWECGMAGLTTGRIPVQYGSVRHLLAGSHPTKFVGEEQGPYPQLLVALSPLSILLNSGESLPVQAGDIVLLDDVVQGGHKLVTLTRDQATHKAVGRVEDMVALILTLPMRRLHVGWDEVSISHLLSSSSSSTDPCPTRDGHPSSYGSALFEHSKTRKNFLLRLTRLSVLGAAGLAASNVATDRLLKILPLKGTLLIAGLVFVPSTTAVLVFLGDQFLNYVAWRLERYQLGKETATQYPDSIGDDLHHTDDSHVDGSDGIGLTSTESLVAATKDSGSPGSATASDQAPVRLQDGRRSTPTGFRLTTRVITDPEDKLAHFDNQTVIELPYWECGPSGSTTVAIPAQFVTLRSLLSGSNPARFAGDQNGPHPQLLVALTPLEILLSSGERQSFFSGDVVLLEDVVRGGHKILAQDGQESMTCLIVTLSQHYHGLGLKQCSLEKFAQVQQSPCPTGENPDIAEPRPLNSEVVGRESSLIMPQARHVILGVLGLTFSSLLGDFIGKTMTTYAVYFAKMCFLAGGMVAVTVGGETLIGAATSWYERKQLSRKDQHEGRHGDEEYDD